MGLAETLHGGLDRVLDVAPLRWLRMRRYERHFAEGKPFLAHRGVYATLEEALQHVPATLPVGYDNSSSGLHLDRTDLVWPSDYPAMFWLSQLLRKGCTTICDVGGNVGVSYYSFGRFLEFPPALRWLVCEVPSIVQQGKALAAERDERKQLAFTESLEDASGTDVLLACGVTQYLPTPLSDSLGKLPAKPRHLIINSAALHPELTFYTVQNIHGDVFVPYRITKDSDFVLGYKRLGYELVDRWDVVEKDCVIPFSPRHSIDRFRGFYFRLAPSRG